MLQGHEEGRLFRCLSSHLFQIALFSAKKTEFSPIFRLQTSIHLKKKTFVKVERLLHSSLNSKNRKQSMEIKRREDLAVSAVSLA